MQQTLFYLENVAYNLLTITMTNIVSIQTNSFDDISEWLTQLQEQNEAWQAIGWEFLTTLRDGINQFGRSNDRALRELYDLASQATGIGIKRLQNLASMSRSEVAQIAQEYELDFGYAEAVLGLSADEADDILHRAKAHAMSVSQVRKEAWIKKQPAPAGGNSSTVDIAADDPPYAEANQYKEYDFTLPDEYDAGSYIAIPREPVAAARLLRQQFNADELDIFMAELIR